MTSVAERVAASAFRSLLRSNGVAVTYRRGAAEAAISAVPGATTVEVVNDEGTVVRSPIRDYLVRVADLASAGFGDPHRGDRIIEGSRIYEAVGPAGDSHFRGWDKSGVAVRIHVNLVDEMEPEEPEED